MAIYHYSAKVFSRGNGQSAVAAMAYRARDILTDERTGMTHDYSRASGLVETEIITPDNTPAWMKDRKKLWNAVEKVEKRKDAQLCREIEVSLPHELNFEQRKNLVQGFVKEQFVNKGMIADMAYHAPGKEGDERNHHVHIMLTMRELTADGFGKKNRSWNDKNLLKHQRERWAYHVNQSLERAGLKERVDHRSFQERGINRQPTQHMGVSATAMERKGEKTRIGDVNREVQKHNRNMAELERRKRAVGEQIARIEQSRKATNDNRHKAKSKNVQQEPSKRPAEAFKQKSQSSPSPQPKPAPTKQQRREKAIADMRRKAEEKRQVNQQYDLDRYQRKLRQAHADLECKQGWWSFITGQKHAAQQYVDHCLARLNNARQRRQESLQAIEKRYEKATAEAEQFKKEQEQRRQKKLTRQFEQRAKANDNNLTLKQRRENYMKQLEAAREKRTKDAFSKIDERNRGRDRGRGFER